MKAYDTFNELDAKLSKLLAGNLLSHKFYTKRYPLVLVIRPEQDVEAQMAMVATDDGGMSPDASIAFSVDADGLRMKINGRLLIAESLMNKIKNLVKKIVSAYLFGAYAERFTANGDDIRYTGKPEDEDDTEDAPDEDDGKMLLVDDIPDDAAEDTDEPDPFAEFFGDNGPAEDTDAE